MDAKQRQQNLAELARMLQKRQLNNAARLVLDVVEPVAFLGSQLAIFVRPFTPRGRWHDYLDALSEEAGWRELHEQVHKQG